MIKNKKGAEHVDWAISIGIFLLFLLTILVYIKPVYKPTYEAETLGEMVKNSFLAENNRTIYRTLVISCYNSQEVCDQIRADIENLGEMIYVKKEDLLKQAEQYKKGDNFILFPHLSSSPKYFVYYNLKNGEGDSENGNLNEPKCNCKPIIGETTEYIGLKSATSIKKFTPIGFPNSKQFNIKIRNANSGKVEGYQGIDPPEDVSVYVYEFVYPSLTWETNQPTKVNYIVSIQIW